VLIDTPTGTGSGVKLAQGIITNEHVIGSTAHITVMRSDGTRAPATAVKCDPRADLALLSTTLDVPAVELAPARGHRQGDPVLVMGYPLSTRLQGSSTLTRGLLSAIRTDERGLTELQTDAAINGGNSGGAMLNMQGRLIGIPYATYSPAQGISLAAASESVQRLLDSPGQPCPSAVPPGTVLASDDFANRLAGFMPLASSVPEAYAVDYVAGEYALRQMDSSYAEPLAVAVPGSYADATLGVDARLAEPSADRLLLLGCRDGQADQTSGYVALIDPSTGDVALGRLNGPMVMPLTDPQSAVGFQTDGAPNRFELTCTGSRIGISVNGVETASADDDRYTDGSVWIGAMALGFENVEARFGHLVVTQR
jgi:S1-C subfamily serine protease